MQMMLEEFGLLGLGQWFRYVTGISEIGSASLLWVPGMGRLWRGAAVLHHGWRVDGAYLCAGQGDFGGVFALGPLAAITLYANRAQ